MQIFRNVYEHVTQVPLPTYLNMQVYAGIAKYLQLSNITIYTVLVTCRDLHYCLLLFSFFNSKKKLLNEDDNKLFFLYIFCIMQRGVLGSFQVYYNLCGRKKRATKYYYIKKQTYDGRKMKRAPRRYLRFLASFWRLSLCAMCSGFLSLDFISAHYSSSFLFFNFFFVVVAIILLRSVCYISHIDFLLLTNKLYI